MSLIPLRRLRAVHRPRAVEVRRPHPGGLRRPSANSGWALSGLTYSGYNIVGAVVILPVVRHLLSERDAVIAGLLAGPLAMLPALAVLHPDGRLLPDDRSATLPSDFMLQRIGIPAFHLLFQAMIFSALLESGTSSVHAINERIDHAWQARSGESLSRTARASRSRRTCWSAACSSPAASASSR